MSRTWISFLIVFLLACLVRFGYVVTQQTYRETDRGELERSALCLARTGTLGDAYGEGTGPSAHCSPLWPCFLALLYQTLGPDTVTARLAQEVAAILLTSFGIALLPLVGRRAGLRPGSGLIAALFLAVLPFNLWVETSGSWEQPACVLVLLGLFAGFTALQECQWRSWTVLAGVGALLGIAALLSPSLLPAAALMMLAEFGTRRGERWRVLAGSLALTACVVVCLAPWVVRNYRLFGGFVPVRSNFGLELWLGNNPRANGRTFPTAWDDPNSVNHQLHPFANREERARLASMGEVAYSKTKQRQALDWIAGHPGTFAGLTLERCRLFWFPPPDLWSPSTGARALRAGTSSLLTLGMIAALIAAFVRRAPARWLLLAIAVGPALPYLITHVNPRYLYPVLWLSALLCADFALRLGAWLVSLYRAGQERERSTSPKRERWDDPSPALRAGRENAA
jgi:hypothetical protein